MRSILDGQLRELNDEMTAMGLLCEKAINLSMEVLLKNRFDLLEQVKEIEKETDQKQRDIEGICMRALLLQQPIAHDLKEISAAMRMISDMERIGDQAQDIAEIAVYCKDTFLKEETEILPMAKQASAMVKKSVDAFVARDGKLALQVLEEDDIVDAHLTRIWGMLANVIRQTPEQAEVCLDLLMIVKYLERIGDHATNLAEWVITIAKP